MGMSVSEKERDRRTGPSVYQRVDERERVRFAKKGYCEGEREGGEGGRQ